MDSVFVIYLWVSHSRRVHRLYVDSCQRLSRLSATACIRSTDIYWSIRIADFFQLHSSNGIRPTLAPYVGSHRFNGYNGESQFTWMVTRDVRVRDSWLSNSICCTVIPANKATKTHQLSACDKLHFECNRRNSCSTHSRLGANPIWYDCWGSLECTCGRNNGTRDSRI